MFRVGGNANFSIFRYGTDMSVSPTPNCGVGCLSQSSDPTQMVLRRSGIQALVVSGRIPSQLFLSQITQGWFN